MKAINKTKLWLSGGLVISAWWLSSLVNYIDVPNHSPPHPEEAEKKAELPRNVNVSSKSASASFPPTSNRVQAEKKAHTSFRGTLVPGGIQVVESRVAADRNLRRLFDYFLTIRGLESKEVILNHLKAYLADKYSDSVIDQVIHIFQQYDRLLDAEAKIDKPLSPAEWKPDDMKTLVNTRMELRREYLNTDVVYAFFDEQERYEQFQLQVFTNHFNGSEKGQSQIEDLAKRTLSEDQWQQRQKTFSFLKIKQAAQPGSDMSIAARDQLIADKFGSLALDRLEQARIEEDKWQQKRRAYLAARNAVFEDQGLSKAEQQDLIRQDALEFLSIAEYRRMRALDQAL